MSSWEPDDARELQDRDDEPSFFTLPLIFPQSDMTLAKRLVQRICRENNQRGQWLVVLVGTNPPQIVLRSELVLFNRKYFCDFSFEERVTTSFIRLVFS